MLGSVSGTNLLGQYEKAISISDMIEIVFLMYEV
ncbi:TPA: hypothetical protein PEC87_000097 [Staphylococcus aureus]|nr:hypothetical protein [Staphylococcus aureus]AQD20056.1 hypothetical protein BZP34_12590 [Staphylococcus aureus]EJX2152470.1 hypothetical protein [Staphylococcus aureus]EKF1813938.1 hypothetical protein [Staphylococcus aureus]MBA5998650.1 hypothetical protein [Staphylococcus aureus]MBA6070392.1 hypothetical protein [Staphylococcus aureus]